MPPAEERIMKAAVVTDFGEPLEIQDLPVPEPGPGQVQVRTEASGLCHTDIHAARGDRPVRPRPPFVPGHEGVGPAVHLPIFGTVLGGITVIGSIVGTRQDLSEVFALHAAGRTQVVAESRRLDQVNESFEEVLGGRAEARLVLRF
jgi:D-arabinose 1-dehydrogenase-like Zn-dependent alcohol dehydrogenase